MAMPGIIFESIFIACAIAKLSIVDSTKFMAPYLIILFGGLLGITYVPWSTLVLPKLSLH
jgi:TRAP-type C4-dicarboxylate transport system permease large subunit